MNQTKIRQWLDRAQAITKTQGARWISTGTEALLTRLKKRDLSFYSKLGTLFVSAYFVSDLVSIVIQSKLPQPRVRGLEPSGISSGSFRRPPTADDYAVIFNRNLFSSAGKIPGEDTEGGMAPDQGGTPVRTSLPFNLVGTIILRDELRSIATIEDRSASAVYPVRIDDEIPSKAKIIKIEPRKVIFINTSSGRREFVELPEELDANLPRVGLAPSKASGSIERQGNNFNVPKNELDRAFADLNSVLTQARAVPHYENGVPAGYKLFQVMPEGFFGKLGLKDQDIICGIDGQPVNDPAKALELLGQLRTANHIELCVKRDGKTQNFAYDVR
ncbi:MAG: type II secretion system protein GspC [Oligoflexia bacterium]|jgi:general secretion pathway protein C